MTTPGQTGGGLADTLNILLDKGLVIDASVKVSLIGIELLAIEARIVIASVDTYIRYLEAMQRVNAQANTPHPGQISMGLGQTVGLIPPPPPTQAVAVPMEPAVTVDQP
ncbi:gas vesicle protein [Amycolatopsis balhimycina DSM 5908]|uniref:Gas vesicle protein A n=1 Tax=Amycolatopsis balhimycina DSM 5908 TaxID=1081091 RepID=A0A428W8U4_AMYBA|nr:gas vesicle protein GvpJ [Amycolatopsis balhimycina]RSM39500.1 gas vesicle protein [Amycolatopsis balhimycina DSM 5908]